MVVRGNASRPLPDHVPTIRGKISQWILGIMELGLDEFV